MQTQSATKSPAVQHARFVERASVEGRPDLVKEVYEYRGMRYSFFMNPHLGGWQVVTVYRRAGRGKAAWWESCGSDRAESAEGAHRVAQERIRQYLEGRARG